jgi:hypothetical protein
MRHFAKGGVLGFLRRFLVFAFPNNSGEKGA